MPPPSGHPKLLRPLRTQVRYSKEEEKRALPFNMAEPITWVWGGAET